MSFARSAPSLICLSCQWRTFMSSARLLAQPAVKKSINAATNTPPPAAGSKATTTNGNTTAATAIATATTAKTGAATPNSSLARPTPASPFKNAPRSYGKRVEAFEPKPLPRPIGMAYPPLPGENTGIDNRTFKQRRDDFVDYDKHLQRRQELKSKMARPYFRDWGNLQFAKGKTFIAPPRPFRADVSLYFPNLYGQTLSKTDKKPRDTTPTLSGKISVVNLYSGVWGETQALSFTGAKENPALAQVIEDSKGGVQTVHVNVEEDTLKYWLIRLFIGNLRAKIGQAGWDKYFIVRRGISDEIRESIGLLNSRVGYVYLVDAECRIRWAGSADSQDHERDGLARSVQRLLVEADSNAAAAATATAEPAKETPAPAKQSGSESN